MDAIGKLMDHIIKLQNSIKKMLIVEDGMLEVIKGLQNRIYKLENPDE